MKKLEEIYARLHDGDETQGRFLIEKWLANLKTERIIPELIRIQLDLSDGKNKAALDSFYDLENKFPQSFILPHHALLRYLRIKHYLKDYCLPNAVKELLHKLGTKTPLWVSYYFQATTPTMCAALLDFGDFYYLPIPKNASSSIGSFWCEKILDKKTINPHSFYPNPFFETVDLQSSKYELSKPVVCITRDENSRTKSYFHGNVKKRSSLVTRNNALRFMGMNSKPSFNDFLSSLDLYKLIFDDVMHHLLPVEAYLNPYKKFKIHLIDFKSLETLESLYPQTFKRGHFQQTHLMVGGRG